MNTNVFKLAGEVILMKKLTWMVFVLALAPDASWAESLRWDCFGTGEYYRSCSTNPNFSEVPSCLHAPSEYDSLALDETCVFATTLMNSCEEIFELRTPGCDDCEVFTIMPGQEQLVTFERKDQTEGTEDRILDWTLGELTGTATVALGNVEEEAVECELGGPSGEDSDETADGGGCRHVAGGEAWFSLLLLGFITRFLRR